MPTKNRFAYRSKISPGQVRQILRYFAVDLDATQIARLLKLNRNTVNRYLRAIRERIAEHTAAQSQALEDDCNEKVIWLARRMQSKEEGPRGHEIILFKILQRRGGIDVEVAPMEVSDRIQAIHRGKIKCNKIFYMNTETGSYAPRPLKGSEQEAFWGYTKARLAKFHGVSNNTFVLHLRESQFRFNNRAQDLYKLVLDLVNRRPLF